MEKSHWPVVDANLLVGLQLYFITAGLHAYGGQDTGSIKTLLCFTTPTDI